MNPFSFIWGKIVFVHLKLVYQPLLNGLYLIYAFLPYHDLGLAIIVLTAIVRLILHKPTVETLRSQRAMAQIQPKLKEVKERFKDNKEEQARRTMALYKEHGIHPLSGCLPILIQFPVLIGLFQVFFRGITLKDNSLFYSFVPAAGSFNPISFGWFDLTSPSVILSVAAGVSQFLQSKFMNKYASVSPAAESEMTRAMKFQTTYFLPFIIIAFSWSMPSAVALYWTIFNILAIVQQLWIQTSLDHERGTSLPKSNFGKDGDTG